VRQLRRSLERINDIGVFEPAHPGGHQHRAPG
jgi:hypothetical protein